MLRVEEGKMREALKVSLSPLRLSARENEASVTPASLPAQIHFVS